ncbi:hypothetical protein ACFVVX_19225 [Kitasatospora sp. NPDC058170]|uniref:hypothetical protein n=1 Tax=Kitasatospora sp. NPDC058170 TaxID=3346364 RepID=UPI0036D95B6E
MSRTVPSKRALALVLAGTVVGAAAALSVPALADTQAPGGSHRATRAAQVPDLTIDPTGTSDLGGVPQGIGNAFGSRAVIKASADGNAIGTAYGVCAKDALGDEQDQVICTSILKFDDKNQISLSAVMPVPHEGAKAQLFDAVVTGGSLAYEGLTGEAHFTPRSDGAYDVSFS